MFSFFFKSPPSLEDVQFHLEAAEDHLTQHKNALTNAQAAACEVIASKREEIQGLSAAIGEANSHIVAAQEYQTGIRAALAK